MLGTSLSSPPCILSFDDTRTHLIAAFHASRNLPEQLALERKLYKALRQQAAFFLLARRQGGHARRPA